MKLLPTMARIAALVAVLVGVALSFVARFVTISVHSEEFSDTFGASAWHKTGVLGLLFPFAALALIGTALGLGLARKTVMARIVDGSAAGALALSILVLVAYVVSNKPEFVGSSPTDVDDIHFDYSLGWSGYAVLALFGCGAVLSIVAAVLPGPAAEIAPVRPVTPPTYPPVPYQITGVPGVPLIENSKATASMILGIVSFACFAPITSIVAIVLATQAKREIIASGGRQAGESKAQAGLILGIVTLALSVLGLVLLVVLLAVGDA